jgi:transcriptional regulator with XRE-family HTH domain
MAKQKQIQPRNGVEKAFGDAMRKARERKKISQMGLFAATGLNRTFISELERGLQGPSLRTLIRIANGIGIHPNELVQDTLDSSFFVAPTESNVGRNRE